MSRLRLGFRGQGCRAGRTHHPTVADLARTLRTPEGARRLHKKVSLSSIDRLPSYLNKPAYGSHWTRLCKSSGVQFSQTKSSPSIAAPIDREDGIGKTPGDSCVPTKPWKYTLMVRTSPETRTRPSSAAIRKTSGSSVPAGIMPAAGRKSIDGSLRSSPFRISGSISASA